ncbi:M18 family aminopeptidase [Clostridium oryzae]|uniref:M18 family aminopeptidase n=1 Tax=Clostridium oryzae TaxID=1450648 RepID=A0A1V4IU65_9CLOT|nr:M18 family aminopeptidase [Clostridium oryzae]OPJ63562.1 putative M18 family aminopeptidase 2 [Clostridium oryzae]
MEQEINYAEELLDFIYKSPSAFQVVDNVKKILNHNGFVQLNEDQKWHLSKQGKYYLTKNDSAILAFIVGTGEIEEDGFKIIGAHTDSPTFKIKPNPEIVTDGYIKLNTEVYGSAILGTWFDRPLSLAGRVTVKSDNIFPETKLINICRPILTIPSLAIHLNSEVNKGINLNRQKDILPVLGLIDERLEKDNILLKLIAGELGINMAEILDFELYLYPFDKGRIIGLNNELISSPRLDDLAMVHSGLNALIQSKPSKGINILLCTDNEEVGSSTKQGAASSFLRDTLERIAFVFGKDKEDTLRSFAKSFIISADLAQAVHPNYGEKYDPTNRININEGPAIKLSAAQAYTSDAISSAVYENICQKAKIPVQKFVNRSDERGGTTIGPISSIKLPINGIDVGTPLLAMHSACELGGVKDHSYITKSFIEFYNI